MFGESEQMAVAFVDSQVLANDDFFLNSYYIKIKAGQTSKSIFFALVINRKCKQ